MRNQTGRTAPLPHSGRGLLLTPPDLAELRADVADQTDDTLGPREA